ncbi:transcriptional regulator, partial [Salmonella enterica subsp. enterica serovar Enteritidis]|nr:transcriptional regulator [Salmonella enterica subsp. enterica serovar Enteritidis]
MNDNDPPLVWIIIGQVTRRKGGKSEGVHVILRAPDDDTAVRHA